MSELKEKIYDSIVFLGKFYGNDKMDSERIQAYVEVLSQELEPTEVAVAIRKIVTTNKFFPTVAEIIEVARGTPLDQATEACAEIIKSIHEFGFYRGKEAMIALGDLWPVVEGVGGWNYICSLSNNELGILRAQIRELAKSKIKKINPSDFQKIAFNRQETLLVSNDGSDRNE